MWPFCSTIAVFREKDQKCYGCLVHRSWNQPWSSHLRQTLTSVPHSWGRRSPLLEYLNTAIPLSRNELYKKVTCLLLFWVDSNLAYYFLSWRVFPMVFRVISYINNVAAMAAWTHIPSAFSRRAWKCSLYFLFPLLLNILVICCFRKVSAFRTSLPPSNINSGLQDAFSHLTQALG